MSAQGCRPHSPDPAFPFPKTPPNNLLGVGDQFYDDSEGGSTVNIEDIGTYNEGFASEWSVTALLWAAYSSTFQDSDPAPPAITETVGGATPQLVWTYLTAALPCEPCDRVDRLLLNLLRPHLNQGYRNAARFTELRDDLARMAAGVEAVDRGIVFLDPRGHARSMTSRARRWISEYFGSRARAAQTLPEAIRRWLMAAAASPADALPRPPTPLVVERPGQRLVVRLVAAGSDRMLVLEERHASLSPRRLESLGLTRREAEVLAWVAEGKTNAEIAVILGASGRTIAKHLEHVYRKLGVETRTAAAAVSLGAMSSSDALAS